MPRTKQAPTAAFFRKLAGKCRRFAANMSDQANAAAFRRMAAEYEKLANSEERASRPELPRTLNL